MALIDWGTMRERDSLSESILSTEESLLFLGVTLFVTKMTFSSLISTGRLNLDFSSRVYSEEQHIAKTL